MNSSAVEKHIVAWLKDYADRARVKGFVVGISGGVDSALTSALCARTGLQTLCLEMPIHQAQSQVTRAQEHMALLSNRFSQVQTARVDLTSVFDAFARAMTGTDALALANSRARLRMTTLYYHASVNGFLVAGTGNKVEDFGVGFYTKYGDGGVDLSPIADLTKTEVYTLARYVGVPESILVAPPTDGLWGDDRTDEDQLGASYPELEWAMQFSGDESELTPRQLEVLAIYRKHNRANQHKMVPIPVCMIPNEVKGS